MLAFPLKKCENPFPDYDLNDQSIISQSNNSQIILGDEGSVEQPYQENWEEANEAQFIMAKHNHEENNEEFKLGGEKENNEPQIWAPNSDDYYDPAQHLGGWLISPPPPSKDHLQINISTSSCTHPKN